MTAPAIEPTTFAGLQESAGAAFVTESVDTFLDERPALMAELRSARQWDGVDASRRAAHSIYSISLLARDPPVIVASCVEGLSSIVRRFAAAKVASDMAQSGFALGRRRVNAAVMFSDIRGLTSMVEQPTPEETVELLNTRCILRLDANNSHGGGAVDSATCAAFGGQMPVTPLGPVQLKGKAASVDVLAVDA